MKRLIGLWLSLLAAPVLAAGPVSLPTEPAKLPSLAVPAVAAAPLATPAAQDVQPAIGALESVSAAVQPGAQAARADSSRFLDKAFDGADFTRDFLAMHDDVQAGRAGPLPAAASAVSYRLIGGFLSNHIHDYFRANLERLRALGLDVKQVPIHTEGKRQEGMSLIERAVRESDKPVVLIAHSRGGTQVTDWYRRASPELKAKVARLVIMQSPLAGTSYLEWYLESAWRRWKAIHVGPWLYRANVLRGLNELTRPTRRWVNRLLPAWRPEDLAKTLTIRTALVHGTDRFYDADNAMMTARGEPDNDGRVAAESGRILGARDIFLHGVDHQQLVLQRPDLRRRLEGYAPHPTLDAGDATEAIVRLLFR